MLPLKRPIPSQNGLLGPAKRLNRLTINQVTTMPPKKPNVFQKAVRSFLRDLIGAKPASPYRRQPISKSLRYQVLERDGFKCVIGGRSANSKTPGAIPLPQFSPARLNMKIRGMPISKEATSLGRDGVFWKKRDQTQGECPSDERPQPSDASSPRLY